MNRYSITCVVVLLACLNNFSFAQVFADVTAAQGVSVYPTFIYNGTGVSFVDFDNDGWDDISFTNDQNLPRFYKNNNGQLEQLESPIWMTEAIKAIIWADYDNDGDKDMLVTRMLNTCGLFRNEGNWTFTDVTLQAEIPQVSNVYSHGGSFGDYDLDGWLDIYISNWEHFTGDTNWILHNNGDGTFTNVSDVLVASDEARRSFQASFVDINHDRWPDIFVANDKNTRNSLYLNDGTGLFTDISEQAGFDWQMESMSSSFADFDRDGDLDVYISNTNAGNRLYRNDGNNHFTDIGVSAGVAFNSVCWGALWVDFDLDGWEDIYVVDNNPLLSDQNRLYRNNGNSTFTQVSIGAGIVDTWRSYSNALGDLNNDGLPDMVVNNDYPQQSKVLRHNATTNHYLTITLEGVVSNREAIGSWVILYADGICQTKYTFCGDNYMSQNSDKLFYGLGSTSVVDSLIIEWPSGMTDTYYNVSSNQHMHYIEGGSIQNEINYDPLAYTMLCDGDSLYLETTLDGTTIWNDGVQGNGRWVSQSGSYSASTTWNDVVYETPELYVFFSSPIAPLIGVIAPSCAGMNDGQVELINTSDYELAAWQEAGSGSTLTDVIEGEYHLLVRDINGCQTEETVFVDAPEPLQITSLTTDVLCNAMSTGQVELTISGGVPPYTSFIDNPSTTQLSAGNYTYQVLDANGCSVTTSVTIYEADPIYVVWNIDENTGEIQLNVSGGVAPYYYQWNTGSTEQNITPVSVGEFFCDIFDANGCTYQVQVAYNFVPQGVDELAVDQLMLFPVPAAQQLNVQTQQMMREIRIIDLHGRLIAAEKVATTNWYTNVLSWAEGIYIIEVLFENGIKKQSRLEVIR